MFINAIGICLKDKFAIEPKPCGDSGFSLPVSSEITFDSVRDYLTNILLETNCSAYEISAYDGFGGSECVLLAVKSENHAFHLSIISKGDYIFLNFA